LISWSKAMRCVPGKPVKEACDFSINEPRVREICNCLAARLDRGVSNHRQEGTCVIETQTA